MRRNFDLPVFDTWKSGPKGGAGFWLLIGGTLLLLANIAMVMLILFPPGGSERDLETRRDDLNAQIRTQHFSMTRLRNVSGKVLIGSQQIRDFEAENFFPERIAYSALIAQIQKMSDAAGVQEREAAFSKEPIEGSDDLTLLNAGIRFQGPYQNLMRFLHEADKDPMLLMIDTVRATPEQRSGEIDAEVRFQAVIREDATTAPLTGGQP